MTHPPGEGGRRGARPGDRLVVVGAVLFTLGLLALVLALVPVFLHTEPMPVVVDMLGALIPVGAVVGALGLTRESRPRQQRPRWH